jgi:hypothetical protein
MLACGLNALLYNCTSVRLDTILANKVQVENTKTSWYITRLLAYEPCNFYVMHGFTKWSALWSVVKPHRHIDTLKYTCRYIDARIRCIMYLVSTVKYRFHDGRAAYVTW